MVRRVLYGPRNNLATTRSVKCLALAPSPTGLRVIWKRLSRDLILKDQLFFCRDVLCSHAIDLTSTVTIRDRHRRAPSSYEIWLFFAARGTRLGFISWQRREIWNQWRGLVGYKSARPDIHCDGRSNSDRISSSISWARDGQSLWAEDDKYLIPLLWATWIPRQLENKYILYSSSSSSQYGCGVHYMNLEGDRKIKGLLMFWSYIRVTVYIAWSDGSIWDRKLIHARDQSRWRTEEEVRIAGLVAIGPVNLVRRS